MPLSSVNFLENLVIPKFPVHGPGCLATYTFLVSQRPTVTLAGDILEARADQTVCSLFQNTPFTVTKNQIKVRKPMDRMTAFRRTIALVDDIALRCNHSTNHFALSNRPWPPQIWYQTNFPGTLGPTASTDTSQRTN